MHDGDLESVGGLSPREGDGRCCQARRPRSQGRADRILHPRRQQGGGFGRAELRNRFRRPHRSVPGAGPRSGDAGCRRQAAVPDKGERAGGGARRREGRAEVQYSASRSSVEQIVEGKLAKFYEENCLLRAAIHQGIRRSRSASWSNKRMRCWARTSSCGALSALKSVANPWPGRARPGQAASRP